jgi:hypothetical protein
MNRLNHNITIDTRADTIEIFGTKYTLELFRTMAFGQIGTLFEIIERKSDGLISVRAWAPGAHDRPKVSPPVPDGT